MNKIMFNDKYGLTEAVLKGRKTMTRRIVPKSTLDKVNEYQLLYYNQTFDKISFHEALINMKEENIIKSSYKVGEVVAIAQSYKDAGLEPTDCVGTIDYGSNMYAQLLACDAKGWNNKMFVLADLMPHHIKITDIKIERLQDISDEDCLREGIKDTSIKVVNRYYRYTYPHSGTAYHTPREAFAALIDKVSGRGTWESNPFVFAYSFKLIK